MFDFEKKGKDTHLVVVDLGIQYAQLSVGTLGRGNISMSNLKLLLQLLVILGKLLNRYCLSSVHTMWMDGMDD